MERQIKQNEFKELPFPPTKFQQKKFSFSLNKKQNTKSSDKTNHLPKINLSNSKPKIYQPLPLQPEPLSPPKTTLNPKTSRLLHYQTKNQVQIFLKF